jgi:hypothetical protein
MATRRNQKLKKSRKNKKRGGADDYELNVRNCTRYWKRGDENWCRKYAGVTNFPGLVNSMGFNRAVPTSKKTGRPLDLSLF